MDRQHFKLAQGYLNIDASALIFTRSGNWQEAEEAKERSPKQRTGNLPRIVMGCALVIAGGLFFSLGKLRSATSGGSIVLALGLIGFGIVKMYKLLNDDFGPVFRIPFAKATNVAYVDDHLVINFLNGAFKEDQVRVKATLDAGIFAESAWQASRIIAQDR